MSSEGENSAEMQDKYLADNGAHDTPADSFRNVSQT